MLLCHIIGSEKKSKSTCTTWSYPRFICQESSVLLILLWFWLFALSSWKWSVIIFTGKLYLYWKIRSAGHNVSTAIYVHSTFEGCCYRCCHLLSNLFKYFVMLCHGQIIVTFLAFKMSTTNGPMSYALEFTTRWLPYIRLISGWPIIWHKSVVNSSRSVQCPRKKILKPSRWSLYTPTIKPDSKQVDT